MGQSRGSYTHGLGKRWWLSPSGDTEADRVDDTSERVWDVYTPSPGQGNVGGGTKGDINLRLPSPKHFRTVYCDKVNYGPESDGGSAFGGAGFEAVAGVVES